MLTEYNSLTFKCRLTAHSPKSVISRLIGLDFWPDFKSATRLDHDPSGSGGFFPGATQLWTLTGFSCGTGDCSIHE